MKILLGCILRSLCLATFIICFFVGCDENIGDSYEEQLLHLHKKVGDRLFHIRDPRIYLFGMGNERKILYKRGVLSDYFTNEVIYRSKDFISDSIIPDRYSVIIRKSDEMIQSEKMSEVSSSTRSFYTRERRPSICQHSTVISMEK